MLLNGKQKVYFLLLSLPILLFGNYAQDKIVNKAIQLKLYNNYTWKALLHIHSNQSSINNSTFLLSYPNFNAKKELIYTLKAFFNTKNLNDKHAICKYPARLYWLKEKLSIKNSDLPNVKCKNLKQYFTKSSFKDIKLIYVSDNNTNPSSAMGHIFFKIEGNTYNGLKQEHAVSFFTVANSYNLPLILYRGTVSGMDGFFTLRPYFEQLNIYLKDENRNIWEYNLNLTKRDKKIIYLHFWELKEAKIKYYYTKFNCATLVYDILSSVYPKFKPGLFWVTPKKVIQIAHKQQLINNGKFLPSNKQKINIIVKKLIKNNDNNFLYSKNFLNTSKLKFSENKIIKNLELELVRIYAEEEYLNSKLSTKNYSIINKTLNNQKTKLDYSIYDSINPIYSIGDIQFKISYIIGNNSGYLLTFLPASHTIYDDNRNIYGETSSKIFELNLFLNKNQISIDSFNLFNIKSLYSWNSFSRMSSYSFKLNYESHFDDNLNNFKAYNISYGKGFTKELKNNFYIYTLINIGLGYGRSKFYAYLYPEIGLIWYENKYLKSVLNYRYVYNQGRTQTGYNDLNLHQSFYINNYLNLGLGINYKKNYKKEKLKYSISFKYIF